MIAGAGALTWAMLVGLLAWITVWDLRTHRIPNGLNAALLLGGLGTAWLTGRPDLTGALAGATLGGLFFLAVAMGFRALRGHDGLGLGDVKFLVGAGAWTGWQGVGPVVFLAALAALVVLGVRRLAGATLDRRAPVAFGGYLCGALLLVRALQQTGWWR